MQQFFHQAACRGCTTGMRHHTPVEVLAPGGYVEPLALGLLAKDLLSSHGRFTLPCCTLLRLLLLCQRCGLVRALLALLLPLLLPPLPASGQCCCCCLRGISFSHSRGIVCLMLLCRVLCVEATLLSFVLGGCAIGNRCARMLACRVCTGPCLADDRIGCCV